MNDWHVWTVVANRQRRITEFLSGLEDIDEFLYPMAEKEYNTKKGKKIKHVPIYANYIFIKYIHNLVTSSGIEKCPWISTYVGKCSAEEIAMVQHQNRQKYDELITSDQIEVGDRVKLIGTPFSGWEATVVDIKDDILSVSISVLGAERVTKCSINDVNIQ